MSAAYMVSPRPIESKPISGLREPVEFEPNKPVEMALKYSQGKTVNTRTGERVMFSLVDGRVMFLDPEPAAKIAALGARAGEKICVCMQWSGKRGDPREWTAWLSTDSELRRAQSDARANGDKWNDRRLEDKMIQRVESAAQAPPIAAAAPAAQQMMSPESLALLSQCRQLVDVFWFTLSYARKEYGDQVSAQTVLGLVQAAAAPKKAGR
jgi:hypothetical protein